MRNGRLFEMVYLLMENGRMSAPALAERFEVSVRTVYRDIEALCAAGVPLVTETGRGGGVRLMEGYTLNRALMSREEQEQLLLSVRAMGGVAGGDSRALLSKLGGLFQREDGGWLDVDFTHWGGGTRDGRFDLLRSAIRERRVLRFRYAGASGVRERRVCPARLCYKGSAWYVQGVCMERGAYRTFRLSRVSGLAATDERFAPLPPLPPLEVFGDEPVPRIRLRFPSRAAWRVYDLFDENQIDNEPDGSLLVTACMTVEDGWLCGCLLGFGGDVEVLEPSSLREMLAERAYQTAMAYREIWERGKTLTRDVKVGVLSSDCSREGETAAQEGNIMEKQELRLCQSCAMPLTEDVLGTEKDGSPSAEYCKYCYRNGEFDGDCTMQQMIDVCVPIVCREVPDSSEEAVRAQYERLLPTLKRWRGEGQK